MFFLLIQVLFDDHGFFSISIANFTLFNAAAPPGVKSDFLSLYFLSLGIKSDFLSHGIKSAGRKSHFLHRGVLLNYIEGELAKKK